MSFLKDLGVEAPGSLWYHWFWIVGKINKGIFLVTIFSVKIEGVHYIVSRCNSLEFRLEKL